MTMNLERQDARTPARVERTQSRPAVMPPVDIFETNLEIVLTADMPGVDDQGIDVTLEHDVLRLEGRVARPERPGYRPALVEYGEGDFERVFTLATEVERDKITAEMKDGVLRVVLPKAAPAKAKKIVVHAK